MWFKQAKIFQLSTTLKYDIDIIETQLSPLVFRPCLPSFPSGHGWGSPIDKEGAPLVHAANGYLLICMQLEEKVLPAAVVQQALDEKLKQIASEQEGKVSRKEKLTLKEDIIHSLLPRAFSKLSRVYGLIDTKNKWLVIDTTTASKIEKFLDLFKKSFGNDAYHNIETKKIAPILTRWLSQKNYPQAFAVEKSCVLKDPSEQTRIIRCQQQDLSAKAIQALITDGCEINQLALEWHDKIKFALSEDFTLKNIRYHEDMLNLAKDQYTETSEQQFDADFFIMTESLSELLTDLLAQFSK